MKRHSARLSRPVALGSLLIAILIQVAVMTHARQNQAGAAQQQDPLKRQVVYKLPTMDQVSVQRDLTYKTVGAMPLKMDVYSPPNLKGDARLPVVIFVNIVEMPPGALKQKEWGQYTSWGRLAAASGLIAVTHESRRADPAADTEDLIKYIRANAASLKIDENRVCVWSCSANVGVGLPLIMQEGRNYIRCAVVYYGTGNLHQLRRDLPLLVVKTGHDNPNLNTGIDNLVRGAITEEAPIVFINYVDGQHGFDLLDDNDESREVIKRTLDFMKFHLSKDATASRASRRAPTPSRFLAIINGQGIERALQVYAEAKTADPEAAMFREDIMNAAGYQLLQNKKTKEAIEVFKLNVAAYPQSANVYDSLGDGYEADGNKAMAIEYAEKALDVLSKNTTLSEAAKENIRNSANDKLRRLKGGPTSPAHGQAQPADSTGGINWNVDTGARVYRFVNGLWFNGKSFEPRTVYSVNGVFRMQHAGPVDSTVDLQGKFIIPPFAEAHNHHFMEGMDYKSQINMYFAQGIFYAKNPNSVKKLTDTIGPHFNKPGGIDVIYSHGGLTATGGHPIQIYDFIAERNILPGMGKAEMKNQAYFVVDTEADLDRQWEHIRAGKPDFIKVYLEYSEEYEARKNDPKYYGQRGLDPRLLPKIVAKAHKDNLRVSAHVNTAMDFHNALVAGVDEVNHLPLARISDEDARLAAERGIVVVTTTLSHRKTDHVTGLDDIHRHNLRLLQRAGVKLAIGTDDNNRTALGEAENLQRLKVFDNLTLLKLWTESTARAIFPHRKIGQLDDGFEASFLALDQNPLEDFASVKKITLRFKQGYLIKDAATANAQK